MQIGRLLTLMLCALCVALAQPASDSPTFDAASLKAAPPMQTGPNRSIYVGMKTDPGRVSITYVPLKFMIRTAYSINTAARISGGPGWLDSDNYELTGTFPADTPNDRMLMMMQTLLTERCKLAVHRENRDQPVYAFTVA